MTFSRLLLWTAPVCLCLLTGCGSSAKDSGSATKLTELKGAGATFPNPGYSKWIDDYKKEHPTLNLSYDAVGSAAGVAQFTTGKADFAGSDVPLTDAEMAKLQGKVFHFPTLVGAVVPVYNVPEVKSELKFTGEVLGRILSGSIKNWSDPAIAKINPDAGLPSLAIHVVRRPADSGTAQIMASFLAKSSPAFKGATAGEEVATSQAVADAVGKKPGAFGYVELNYAVQGKLAFGSVKNSAGEFQKATFESLGAALDTLTNMPPDFRAMATNGTAKNAYPLANFTFLIVPAKFEDTAKRDAMKRFLGWVYDINAGQKSALALDYNILPPSILDNVRAQVDRIQ